MNPAMSSWVALRQRITFTPGQSVLILGATGNAGRWPCRSPNSSARPDHRRRPDAGQLAALPALGATGTVLMEGDPDGIAARLGKAAADIDVVIDYLWGKPAAAAIPPWSPAAPTRASR